MIELGQERLLAFHFKMTGKLLYLPGEAEVDKHTHLVFSLSGGSRLHFRDTRKFGYCLALSRTQLAEWPFYASLGPEPLDMDADEFVEAAHRSGSRIKAVLLDQKRIAGIGNIYADEALFRAGIHPAASACGLPGKRLAELHASLRWVLTRAIDSGGTTFRDYVDGLGRPGSYQDQFLVYGRAGLPCRDCGTTLDRARVAGRTSVFCPSCQPAA
jgi:formamidopyrimidine-DNA glycosylase